VEWNSTTFSKRSLESYKNQSHWFPAKIIAGMTELKAKTPSIAIPAIGDKYIHVQKSEPQWVRFHQFAAKAAPTSNEANDSIMALLPTIRQRSR